MLHRIWKPWYVWRPDQLAKRLVRWPCSPAAGFRPLPTSWGGLIVADPSKPLGMSIHTTGVYDLSVSEVMLRLVRAGDLVVDAGANVGYMTVLAAVAAGPSGTVHAFEPHPGLFSVLEQNVAASGCRFALARVVLHNVALGDQVRGADLALPEALAANDGLAYIVRDAGQTPVKTISVRLETLDRVVTEDISVMKLDVEGFELQVLEGAARALRSGRIRHIVFEDHSGTGSGVMRLLASAGYHLYSIGWSVWGPKVLPIGAGRLAASYEAPNYLATIEPHEVLQACATPGWLTLRRRIRPRINQTHQSPDHHQSRP
jgi:FkbM family methyltransferase